MQALIETFADCFIASHKRTELWDNGRKKCTFSARNCHNPKTSVRVFFVITNCKKHWAFSFIRMIE